MNCINDIQFHRNPDTPGIEICEVHGSRHQFPNHSHDEIYAFSLMAEGQSSWNGKTGDDSLVSPGKIAVIPPGLVHSGSPTRGLSSTYRMIYINQSIIAETASNIMERNISFTEFEKIVMDGGRLGPLYNSLFDAVSRNASPMETDSAITSFMGLMISEYGIEKIRSESIKESAPAMQRARDFLAADVEKKITLDDAAAAAGLSKYHFLRLFKQYTGMSPHAFRTTRRIEAARKYIIQGRSFSEVALETGFSDQSHLTNQFRKYIGASPAQYLAG